jgi:hypothetical protein
MAGSHGAGWMANYCRGRARLEGVVTRWRDRVSRKATAYHLQLSADAVYGNAAAEIAELRLGIASLLRTLRASGALPKTLTAETPAMTNSQNLFDRYLEGADIPLATPDDLDVGEEQAESLFSDIGELRLVLASRLKMLVDGAVLSRDDLEQMADEIDALDGTIDGKFTGQIAPDGTIAVPPPKEPDAFDDLIDGADQERRRGR